MHNKVMTISPRSRRFFFTIDVDWIPGSESGLAQLYEFCDVHQLRGTYFVTGQMAVDYPELIKQAAARGHELGTHGWQHGQQEGDAEEDFASASYDEQLDWIRRSTEAVTAAAGTRPEAFRAPNLKVSETTLRALEALNYRYDSSVPARRLTVTAGKLNSVRYYWAPLSAYRPSMKRLSRPGDSSVVEVPPSAFFIPLNMSALRVFGLAALKWTVDRVGQRSRDLVFFSHPSEFVPASQQRLTADNPSRHLKGIGPENFDLLSKLVKYVQQRGYESALFRDIDADRSCHVG